MRINEAFPSQYIKAADLQGRDVTLIIKEVKLEDLGDDTKPVVYFNKTDRGLVLNRTNATTIANNLGTDEMDQWAGKAITMFPTQTDFQGRQVEAIRIRLRRPAPKQPLPAPSPQKDDLPNEMNPADENEPPF